MGSRVGLMGLKKKNHLIEELKVVLSVFYGRRVNGVLLLAL